MSKRIRGRRPITAKTLHYGDLFEAILSLETTDEISAFLRDLLTEGELEELSARWQAARMLKKGLPYTEITDSTGLSSATVARVSKWLKKGAGGYRIALARGQDK